MAGRIIAIGDVHGCAVALEALLDWIAPGAEDVIVPLGDYIDRGPDSRGVVEQLLEWRRRCRLVPLMGNHERMLLAARADTGELEFWLAAGGLPTLESYRSDASLSGVPESHFAFFEECRDFYQTDTHLFVHANYLENVPIERTPEHVLRWESLRARTPGPHCSGKTVIVGHTRQYAGEVLDLGYLKCIDTYCCGGLWLTALDVTTGRIWQTNDQGQRRAAGH